MDRALIYDGQVPLATDLLNTNKNALLGLGYFMQDMLGVNTVVNALPCVPTVPGSLAVTVGAGRIYSLQPIDASAYSDIAADATDNVVKQGINLNTTQLSCPAPTVAGTSIIYLIEGCYSESDTNLAVLPYYNEASPSAPFAGPAGSNVAQPTRRAGIVGLASKAGLQAAQPVAPGVDSGYVPLYLVTVPYGTTAITGSMIAIAPGAPFITGNQLSEATADARYLKLSGGTLTGSLTGTSAVFQSITVNGISVRSASLLNTGVLSTAVLGSNPNNANANTFLRGDGTWQQVYFPQITGQVSPAQVPLAAVANWQTSLSINWSQLQGVKNADQLQGYTINGSAAPYTIAFRDGNGNLAVNYLYQASENSENPTVSQIVVTAVSDSFFRKADIAWVFREMILSGAVTIQADPGGTPNLAPGQMAFYY